MDPAARAPKILQGFGDFRPKFGGRRKLANKLGAGVQLAGLATAEEDDLRFGQLRLMAQELSAGLRKSGQVCRHSWYHKFYADTFVSDDAVSWIQSKKSPQKEDYAVQLMQELLDCGFIRRVSKHESTSSIGWEATDHVVISKRRFKHTKHTLYRFDDELSEKQLHVEVSQADLDPLLRANKKISLFARVSLGGRVFRTLAIKKTSRPEWRQKFVFGLDHNENEDDGESMLLCITVLQASKHPFTSRELASVSLPVATIPQVTLPHGFTRLQLSQLDEFYRWYDVVAPLKQGETAGRIEIGCCLAKTNVAADDARLGRRDSIDAEKRRRSLSSSLSAHRVVTDYIHQQPSLPLKPVLSKEPLVHSKRAMSSARMGTLKTNDGVRGGLRYWRVRIFIEGCEDVRYDLAETYGLPWVMEVKVIVGSTVSVTHASDRDRVRKGAYWGKRLTLDVYANQRVDDLKLVVCQRAKYDLVTRHVGAVSIPLSQISVVEQGVPFAETYNLQRMKHGSARKELNGTLSASVWLRDIRPLQPAPFGWKHFLIADVAIASSILYFLSRRAALSAFLALTSPLVYLYRREFVFGRLVGECLSILLRHVAPLGLELSFKSVSVEARISRGRFYVTAVVRDFAFGNPGPGFIPPSLVTGRMRKWRRTRKRIARMLARTFIFRCFMNIVFKVIARLHFKSSGHFPVEDLAGSLSFASSTVRTATALREGGRMNPWPRRKRDGSAFFAVPLSDSDDEDDLRASFLSPHHAYPPRFFHPHFVSASEIRAEISACFSSVWGVVSFLAMLARGTWNTWRASPEHMSILGAEPDFEIRCLGLLRIEKLVIEDAKLSFCTSLRGRRKGELNVNAVVRRIADTKVAIALEQARRRNASVTRAILRQLAILLNPWRQSWLEAKADASIFEKISNVSTSVSHYCENGRSAVEEEASLRWPNVLEGDIFWGCFFDTDCDVATKDENRVYKVVVRVRGKRVESPPSALGKFPAFNKRFEVRTDDASTVLHVAVYEVKKGYTRGSSLRLCGQWCMTIKYLITKPDYCHHETLWVDNETKTHENSTRRLEHFFSNTRVSEEHSAGWQQRWRRVVGESRKTASLFELETTNRWVYIKAKMSDAHWRPTTGRLCMRLRWRDGETDADSPLHGSPTDQFSFGYAKPLDQLRSNSDETRLRLGDVEAVRHMLASFPFRLEMANFQLINFRIFVKDLFLGSESEMSRLSQDFNSPHLSALGIASMLTQQSTSAGSSSPSLEKQQQGTQAVKKEFRAIRIQRLLLDGTLIAPKHEGGFDLNEFLRTFVNKGSSEVLRTAPIMSIVFQIVPALITNLNVLWGGGGTYNASNSGDSTSTAAMSTMARAPVSPRTPTTLARVFRRNLSGLSPIYRR